MSAFTSRLGAGPALTLDGALGTELERRGVASGLPLWSTHGLLEAPEVVRAIHRDYLEAGAEVLTAATFRTQRRTLDRAGLGDRAGELTTLAVRLARSAIEEAGRVAFVAGSAPPLEDCYRPDRVPDDESCAREHAEHAAGLAAAGVDAIAVETHNTVREARAAARAAAATGLPFWVAFVCDPRSRLLSGERLADAVEAVREYGPCAVGVNCVPPSSVDACLPELFASGLPIVAYANLGAPSEDGAFRSHDCQPREFGAHARRWRDAGVRAIGGCCGTTPDHVRELALALRSD